MIVKGYCRYNRRERYMVGFRAKKIRLGFKRVNRTLTLVKSLTLISTLDFELPEYNPPMAPCASRKPAVKQAICGQSIFCNKVPCGT